MNSDEKRIADRIREGLRRCMPVTKADNALTCDTCPYNRICDQTDYAVTAARLPVTMINDIRKLVTYKEDRR